MVHLFGRKPLSRVQAFRLRPYLLLGCLALAFGLRLIRLDFQPLWWDEGYTVFFATRDFATMLARTAVDIQPPLYYALLQLWMPLAGKSEVALRLFSVAVGLAAIPLIYLLGRQLYGARVGIWSAFLLAISPLHIYYSQEVRMYGLVTTLALASLVLQLALLQTVNTSNAGRSTNRRAWLWALYILVTTATLYTHYFAAFFVAAEVLAVLYARPRRRNWSSLRAWFAAWLAVFLLYLPWLVYAGLKLYVYVTAKVGIEQYSRLDPLTFLGQHLVAFSVGHVTQFAWLGGASILFVALAALGIWKLRAFRTEFQSADSEPGQTRNENLRLTLLCLFVPLVLGWVLNLVYTFHPIRYERLFLFAAPLLYLLVALGLEYLRQRQALLAVTALVVLCAISSLSLFDFYTNERYTAEDYRPLIQRIESMAQPGDVVLAPYPWQIGYMEAYYHGPPVNVFEVPADEWGSDSTRLDNGLNALRASTPRVWLLAYQVMGHRLEDQLANYYADDYRLDDEAYGNTRIEYFVQAADPPIVEQPLIFAPDLQLASSGASAVPITAGSGFVRVRLHWVARANAYNYSLRLVDGHGKKVVQQDGEIPSDNVVERRGLVVGSEVPPGEYDLQLVVYVRATGTPVRVPNVNSELTLTHVTVTAPR